MAAAASVVVSEAELLKNAGVGVVLGREETRALLLQLITLVVVAQESKGRVEVCTLLSVVRGSILLLPAQTLAKKKNQKKNRACFNLRSIHGITLPSWKCLRLEDFVTCPLISLVIQIAL